MAEFVISFSPGAVDISPAEGRHQERPQTVTVTNIGSTAVSVSGVSLHGASKRDYSQINTCGSQIGAG